MPGLSDDAHSGGESDFASSYGRFSSELDLSSLKPEVVAAAKTNLLDTLACATAGISAAGVAEVVELVTEWGGKREASIWCRDARVPAHQAALVNGMMAHARDYDDTHDAAVLHAGVSVIPAAIAAAQLQPSASGRDLLAGIISGLELICRLGKATTIGIIESGFMYTSLFGHFAATVAAARVLRLNAADTANALGIAYSQAAGTHQVTRDGALTKRMQPGFAAHTGLLSVALARRGIRGTRNTFEGVDGLFRSFLRGRFEREVLREGLGSRFEFLNLSYKPYPCCRFNHAPIEAALEIRRQAGGRLSDIESISCGVNRQAYEAVCTPANLRRRPQTVVQAQFSLPFSVACALVNGVVGLNDFTDESIRCPEVLAISDRIEAHCDPVIERDWSRNVSPAVLTVRTRARTFAARVDIPRGHPESPLSEAALSLKLMDCLSVSGLASIDSVASELRQRVAQADRLVSGAEVIEPLTIPSD